MDISADFQEEFDALTEEVQDKIVTRMLLLEDSGPQLSRPHADMLKGSKHANMKELRFDADNGVWRAAYAFDPKRNGILLVAGDKKGQNEKKFYKALIKTADERYDAHLEQLE